MAGDGNGGSRRDSSPLEHKIVQTIEDIGWHAYLWFPIVQRQALQFPPDPRDEEIHAAVVNLVRKGALIFASADWWRPPNWSPAPDLPGAILPSPGYLARLYRMPIPYLPLPLQITEIDSCPAALYTLPKLPEQDRTGISYLEAQIIVTIDHIGWYAYLWFPVIYREMLNFGSEAPEETVHSAIVGLVRRGVLTYNEEEGWVAPLDVLRLARGLC